MTTKELKEMGIDKTDLTIYKTIHTLKLWQNSKCVDLPCIILSNVTQGNKAIKRIKEGSYNYKEILIAIIKKSVKKLKKDSK